MTATVSPSGSSSASSAFSSFHHELQASRVYARTRQTSRSASLAGNVSYLDDTITFDATSTAESSTLFNSKGSSSADTGDTVVQAPSSILTSRDPIFRHHLAAAAAVIASSSSAPTYPAAAAASPITNSPVYPFPLHALPSPLSRPLLSTRLRPRPYSYLNFSSQRAHPLPPFVIPSNASYLQNQRDLVSACYAGDVPRSAALLQAGVDPNTREHPTGRSDQCAPAIHIATMGGHHDVVRCLLRYGARVDEPFRGFRTPLHEAVRNGDTALTILLLDNGAPLICRDESGYQPLHVAVMGCHVPCARLLVWAGAPVNCMGNDFLTPLHHVAMLSGNMDLVELLLSHGADPRIRTRWLLGNKFARDLARERGYENMEARLIEWEDLMD